MRQLKDLGLIIAYELHGFRYKLYSKYPLDRQKFVTSWQSDVYLITENPTYKDLFTHSIKEYENEKF